MIAKLPCKVDPKNPEDPTLYRVISKDIEAFASGDHIGLLLDYDEETWTFSKGGKRVYKGQFDYDLKDTDLYICVGFYHSNKHQGSSIQLVTARKGM